MNTWLSVISLAVAFLSVAFTAFTYRDRRRAEREVHISRVTAHNPSKDHTYSGLVSEQLPDTVIVRNDGPSSVVVASAGLVYGEARVLPTEWSKPRSWRFRQEAEISNGTRLLPPGAEVTVALTDDDWQSGAPGPWEGAYKATSAVAFVTDAHGRLWRRTEWDWTDLSEESKPLTGWALKGDRWLVHLGWLERPSRWLHRRVKRRAQARPWRLPWEFHLLQWTYGWRESSRRLHLLPTDAPRTWQWPGMLAP